MSQYPAGEYLVIICKTWRQRLWAIKEMLRQKCGIALCTINPDYYDNDDFFNRWKKEGKNKHTPR